MSGQTCPNCQFVSEATEECPSCGVIFRKFRATDDHVDSLPAPSVKKEAAQKIEDEAVAFWGIVVALPAAFLFAPLAKLLILPGLLFGGVQIWIHEFGHALISWLGGHAATPIGLGWTNMEPNRSMFVFACFLFLLGITTYRSIEHKLYFPAAIAGALIPLQVYFTFVASVSKWDFAVGYGGIGGEFYLSTLLIVAFYYEFPAKIRWDFFRWFFLLAGAYAFFHTYRTWIQISHREASIPWGTLWGGESDSGGDMNRLYDEHGWTKQEIIRLYLKTGMVCTVAIVAHYVTFAARALVKRSTLGR
jgi:hypothetical protein